MKKLLSLLLITVMLLGTVMPLAAADDITVLVDGKKVEFDVPPQIINGRTMVPLRAIFNALGATVTYDSATKTVSSQKGDTKVQLTIDDPVMYVNGTAKTLDTPGTIVDGRTLVPLRAVGEAYGATVSWDAATRIATIKSPVVKPAAFQDSSLYAEIKTKVNSEVYYLIPEVTYNNTRKELAVRLKAATGLYDMLKVAPSKDNETWNQLTSTISGLYNGIFSMVSGSDYSDIKLKVYLYDYATGDTLYSLSGGKYPTVVNIMDKLIAAIPKPAPEPEPEPSPINIYFKDSFPLRLSEYIGRACLTDVRIDEVTWSIEAGDTSNKVYLYFTGQVVGDNSFHSFYAAIYDEDGYIIEDFPVIILGRQGDKFRNHEEDIRLPNGTYYIDFYVD